MSCGGAMPGVAYMVTCCRRAAELRSLRNPLEAGMAATGQREPKPCNMDQVQGRRPIITMQHGWYVRIDYHNAARLAYICAHRVPRAAVTQPNPREPVAHGVPQQPCLHSKQRQPPELRNHAAAPCTLPIPYHCRGKRYHAAPPRTLPVPHLTQTQPACHRQLHTRCQPWQANKQVQYCCTVTERARQRRALLLLPPHSLLKAPKPLQCLKASSQPQPPAAGVHVHGKEADGGQVGTCVRAGVGMHVMCAHVVHNRQQSGP